MRLFPAALPPARTVRAAVRLMYAGAAITALTLLISIVSLAFFGRSGATLRLAGSSQPFWVAVTVGVAGSLIVIALWLWMARTTGQGRNWARSLSTVLFGVATLDLTGAFRTPGIRVEFVPMLFGPTVPVLTWLVGLAAVWLLWRPASSAFFKPQAFTQARHGAQPPSRIGPSSSRLPRQL